METIGKSRGNELEGLEIATAKEWVLGCTQAEFEARFQTKVAPFADCIPDPIEWVKTDATPKIGIDPVTPESYEEVSSTIKPEQKEKKKEKPVKEKPVQAGHICEGCKREFSHKIGLYSHRKQCKDALNMKMVD